jgi:hypothetical protein
MASPASSKSMIRPPVLRTIVQGLPQFPTARAIAPAPAPGAAAAAVEETATANKHKTRERILMMHLQWCIRTKGLSILGLVVSAEFIKIVSDRSRNVTGAVALNGKSYKIISRGASRLPKPAQ